MVESRPSRRKLFAVFALVILLVGTFIILRPRLWVKNKTAKVIVDGQLSENVKLYHGSDGRLLFYLKDEPAIVHYYSAESGVLKCRASEFASLKIVVFSPRAQPFCSSDSVPAAIKQQSLEFLHDGRAIVVSWQAAPR